MTDLTTHKVTSHDEGAHAQQRMKARSRNGPGLFTRFSTRVSDLVGSPFAFAAAVAMVLLWAVSGPLFGFSSTWQLVINTGTTIVTFLMVFLIQSTQNRDSRAVHLKLDAIIDAFDEVREDMVDIEHASDEDLEAMQEEFEQRREQAEEQAR